MRSLIEDLGEVGVLSFGRDGPSFRRAVCTKDAATGILSSEAGVACLPIIRKFLPTPTLVGTGGKAAPRLLSPGFHEDLGVFVWGDPKTVIPEVPLPEAVAFLTETVLGDYEFKTKADKGRAVAALLTPGLKFGGFLEDCTPMNYTEADRPNAGKTYLAKVSAAIYGFNVTPLTPSTRGVGSLKESVGTQLLEGAAFILIDNVRRLEDTEFLEAALTNGTVSVRPAYKSETTVSIEQVCFDMTTNGVTITPDLASRSNMINIRHRPGHQFREHPEGDLLRHVKVNQPFALGCVHAVIREWHARGRPRTEENRSRFKDWARTLDWIVQEIFKLPPLLTGTQEHAALTSSEQVRFLAELMSTALKTLPAHALTMLPPEVETRDGRLVSITLFVGELMEIAGQIDFALPSTVSRMSDPDAKSGALGTFLSKDKALSEGSPVVVDDFEIAKTRRVRSNRSCAPAYIFRPRFEVPYELAPSTERRVATCVKPPPPFPKATPPGGAQGVQGPPRCTANPVEDRAEC